MNKTNLKTPISYYGGKALMLKHIIPLIPPHTTYTESFCGGAAVFFSKPKSEVECINDMNGHVVNFCRVLKQDFALLKMLIEQTPNSRQVHRESEYVLKNHESFSEIRRAWAFWVQTNMSFSSTMFGGYAYAVRKNSQAKKLVNKKLAFNKELSKRMDLLDIENNDAVKVIKSRDTLETFHYVDPPYFNSNCGHYGGYTLENFVDLLTCLSNIQGKFLLSSYPSDALTEFSERNGWNTMEVRKKIVACRTDRTKEKVEVLTSNYQLLHY
jgi:DNA adenine methylase